jgi:hypothetical protein
VLTQVDTIDAIEEALFAKATDAALLDRLLRGYKMDDELKDLVRGKAPAAKAAPKAAAKPARGRAPGARKGAR